MYISFKKLQLKTLSGAQLKILNACRLKINLVVCNLRTKTYNSLEKKTHLQTQKKELLSN